LVNYEARGAETIKGAIDLAYVCPGAMWSASAKLSMKLETICGTQGQDP
jgi:hypothetical protein